MAITAANEGKDPSEEKRNKLALRLKGRGHSPCKAFVVSSECLPELKRRLDEVELLEAKDTSLALNNFISGLVSKSGQRKTKQLPLLYEDLPDDLVRVKKCKIKRLEGQCQELAQQICGINNQIQIFMSYENSEDRVANLEQNKSEVESELRKKQEELATLKNSLQDTD